MIPRARPMYIVQLAAIELLITVRAMASNIQTALIRLPILLIVTLLIMAIPTNTPSVNRTDKPR